VSAVENWVVSANRVEYSEKIVLASWVQVDARFVEKEYILVRIVILLPSVEDSLQGKKCVKPLLRREARTSREPTAGSSMRSNIS